MTFSNRAPVRTASYVSFVPPSIEKVKQVIPASRIFPMFSSLRSVPFVMISLWGTPNSRTAFSRSGKSRVINGSVMMERTRMLVCGNTCVAIDSNSRRGMSYFGTAPTRESLKPHILHFRLHRLFWSMKTLRVRPRQAPPAFQSNLRFKSSWSEAAKNGRSAPCSGVGAASGLFRLKSLRKRCRIIRIEEYGADAILVEGSGNARSHSAVCGAAATSAKSTEVAPRTLAVLPLLEKPADRLRKRAAQPRPPIVRIPVERYGCPTLVTLDGDPYN